MLKGFNNDKYYCVYWTTHAWVSVSDIPNQCIKAAQVPLGSSPAPFSQSDSRCFLPGNCFGMSDI